MGEPAGDIERTPIVLGELAADPSPKRRRVRPHVHGHVEERATGAAHELYLRKGRHLVVQAAQRPATTVERDVALLKFWFEPMLREFVRAPRAGEEAPLVHVSLLLDHVDAREAGRDETHAISIRAYGP